MPQPPAAAPVPVRVPLPVPVPVRLARVRKSHTHTHTHMSVSQCRHRDAIATMTRGDARWLPPECAAKKKTAPHLLVGFRYNCFLLLPTSATWLRAPSAAPRVPSPAGRPRRGSECCPRSVSMPCDCDDDTAGVAANADRQTDRHIDQYSTLLAVRLS